MAEPGGMAKQGDKATCRQYFVWSSSNSRTLSADESCFSWHLPKVGWTQDCQESKHGGCSSKKSYMQQACSCMHVTCMHARMRNTCSRHASMHACMQACRHAGRHASMHACMQACRQACKQACKQACTQDVSMQQACIKQAKHGAACKERHARSSDAGPCRMHAAWCSTMHAAACSWQHAAGSWLHAASACGGITSTKARSV